MLTVEKAGIYSITNKVNGKQYIGSSVRSIKIRWWEHKVQLRKNIHLCYPLQQAWNKYGEDSFLFTVIENLDNPTKEEIISLEQSYLDNLKPFAHLKQGYNVRIKADSNQGVPMKQEQKDNLSKLKSKFDYLVISPEGETYITHSLSKFAKEHHLTESSLHRLVRGASDKYKGWQVFYLDVQNNIQAEKFRKERQIKGKSNWRKAIDKACKTYNLITPEGKNVVITNLRQFCLANNLCYPAMKRVTNPNIPQQQYNNWKGFIVN